MAKKLTGYALLFQLAFKNEAVSVRPVSVNTGYGPALQYDFENELDLRRMMDDIENAEVGSHEYDTDYDTYSLTIRLLTKRDIDAMTAKKNTPTRANG